jgi:hypothetical protein
MSWLRVNSFSSVVIGMAGFLRLVDLARLVLYLLGRRFSKREFRGKQISSSNLVQLAEASG